MAIDPQAGFALDPNQRMAERLADLERRLARSERRGGGLRTGFVYAVGGTVAPAGTLLCNGADYARADYPALFAAIGTTHGASNASLFRVPNLSGRSPMGAGAGAGLTARAAGETPGAESVAITTAQMPWHQHGGATGAAYTAGPRWQGTQGLNVFNAGGGYNFVAITYGGNYVGGDGNKYADFNHDHYVPPLAITAEGGSQSHPNVHPSTVLTFVIAT